MHLRFGYKESDVGIIPADWNAVSVGSLASFTSGVGIDIASLSGESSDTPVPVFGGNGIAGFTSKPLVHEATVVVGRVGQKCGEVYFSFGPSWITDNALYPKVKHRAFHMPYLALALRAAGLNEFRNRNDLPLVTQAILHSVRIPWPCAVEEQRTIASILSDTEALIEALECLIVKKRDVKQAAMQQLLTPPSEGGTRLPGFNGEWEVKRIGDFADCTAGGTPATGTASYWGGRIRWMSSGELNLKRVHEVEGRITDAGLANSAAKMLPAGSVLVGLAGQGKTRGTVAMNLVELCTNQSIAGILPNGTFVPDYLYYNLDARYDELRELSSGGGGRGGLNLKLIRSLTVPFPLVKEQQTIAAILSEMDAELVALEQRRDKMLALKQAMMQDLLTGKTRLVAPGGAHA